MSIIDTNVRNLNKTKYFNSFLTLNNNNDSSNDYSGGVTEFKYTNTDSSNTLFISELVINIKDDGTFNMDNYGNIGNSLINGINIYYTDTNGSNRNDIIGTTFNIKKNSDYFNYTSDIILLNNNTGESVFTVNLNFQKNYSNIKLELNDKIAIELNDDLTNITEQTFSITGFKYSNSDLI